MLSYFLSFLFCSLIIFLMVFVNMSTLVMLPITHACFLLFFYIKCIKLIVKYLRHICYICANCIFCLHCNYLYALCLKVNIVLKFVKITLTLVDHLSILATIANLIQSTCCMCASFTQKAKI